MHSYDPYLFQIDQGDIFDQGDIYQRQPVRPPMPRPPAPGRPYQLTPEMMRQFRGRVIRVVIPNVVPSPTPVFVHRVSRQGDVTLVRCMYGTPQVFYTSSRNITIYG
jgi:hypothetical protein